MFQNLKNDFRREWHKSAGKGKLRALFNCLWSPGFQAVVNCRMCRWLVQKRVPLLNIPLQRISELLTGISIPPTAKIGRGLLIEHFGGIVVNAGVEAGEQCTLSHQVTIGNSRPGGRSPKIGNNVYICVGAKILGDIVIGDNCIIGANTVLTKSVPANSVVAGMPGKIIKTFQDTSEYKEFFK